MPEVREKTKAPEMNRCGPVLPLKPICIQDGRPSLRPGTPGGSEESHPQAGTRAYYKYAEESDAAHPLTWVPGRYTLEGELVLLE